MRIGQLANRTGETIDTLRFYEKRGLFGGVQVLRSANGYREYDEQVVERVAMIRQAQAAGFSLSEICELFALWDRQELSDQQIVAHLQQKRRQILARIAELQHMDRYLEAKIAAYEQVRPVSTGNRP